MAEVIKTGDVGLLTGKVAVLGYGSQGHAHALNLADSGVEVEVGLRPDSGSRAAAEEAGLTVRDVPDAVRDAQIVVFLVPDGTQGALFRDEVAANLAPGAALLFAHGFAIHFAQIEPPEGHDVIMVAPKGPGHIVRRLYEEGYGTPALIAVAQDASGRARDLALAYGVAIGAGRAGMIDTTFKEETESDLFGEQSVLCGGTTQLIKYAFETLVEAGYQPEIAYYECLHELKLIVDLIYEGGLERMHYSISDTAEYGSHAVGPRVIDQHVKDNMRKVLTDIQDGSFAREWIAEMNNGRPSLAEYRRKLGETQIEQVGARLRALGERTVQGAHVQGSEAEGMASVDVQVGLLGYGTVGAAVNRLLNEQADDIERATGHRLRVVKALVRNVEKERGFPPGGGVLTTDAREILDDPEITIVAEVMGGVEPAGGHVLEMLRAGKHVVTANKQLVARRGAELFDAASAAGVQVRFEASVCAAIPVIKVLRESLVVTNVHRVLGIVNGTTNFVLTEMEAGATYEEALREAQARGFAEADPTDDVSGADAAAKMAILATVAFNSRYELVDVDVVGIDKIDPLDIVAARELDMVIRLVGAARLVDGAVDVRVGPALVDRRHPLAAIKGAFNAVMLQGDAIREITLEGPGAGGIETASAVIADMASVIGTMGTGFLQNDPVWRQLPRLAPGDHRSPFYFHLSVADRPGVLARVADALGERDVSIARLLQHPNGDGAALHVVTHEARQGALDEALTMIASMEEVRRKPLPFPVVSDRGVSELGWA